MGWNFRYLGVDVRRDERFDYHADDTPVLLDDGATQRGGGVVGCVGLGSRLATNMAPPVLLEFWSALLPALPFHDSRTTADDAKTIGINNLERLHYRAACYPHRRTYLTMREDRKGPG